MTHPVAEGSETRGEMQLILMSLLCCVSAARACLQCDRTVRLLHEDFILAAPIVIDQIEMKMICDHAYVTYRETSQERKGVIGGLESCFHYIVLKYRHQGLFLIIVSFVTA